MKRANDAHAAFVRALHQRPEQDQASLTERERARLDQLEARIRDRDKEQPEKLERRLVALEKLRASIL